MINEDHINAGNAAISKFMERSHVMNYHESWNLLIPVIEKLTQSQFRAVLYFNPDASSAVVYDPLNHSLEIQQNGPREDSIMTAWKSVTQFLEQQKSKRAADA